MTLEWFVSYRETTLQTPHNDCWERVQQWRLMNMEQRNTGGLLLQVQLQEQGKWRRLQQADEELRNAVQRDCYDRCQDNGTVCVWTH